MATINILKRVLRDAFDVSTTSVKQPLSDAEYSAGFNSIITKSVWKTYQDFIIPELSQLLALSTEASISVLEIGPGSKSVLDHLPLHLRQKIGTYTAFEPNSIFATQLEVWLGPTSGTTPRLPCLRSPPIIHNAPFVAGDDSKGVSAACTNNDEEKYDIVLFCHSMYGLEPPLSFIKQALLLLVESPLNGIVVVFHRNGDLDLDSLICSRSAQFPAGFVRVSDDDKELDRFASFIAGFAIQNEHEQEEATRAEWRRICRALGHREEDDDRHLIFSSPNVMLAFTRSATKLPELTKKLPLVTMNRRIKNYEALYTDAPIIRPTEMQHVQQGVQWALKHGTGLTVIGGTHSGHCIWPNIVAVDMSAFDQIHLPRIVENEGNCDSDYDSLIVAESGCKTGDIIRKAMLVGLTVPLGARPSVGTGLWLQGGIGHLARLHGLACDAIVGAVIVSVESGDVLCIGRVPTQYRPTDAIRPDNEADLLWALKGAGTNFGIVTSITFKASPAQIYLVRNWNIPLQDTSEALLKLKDIYGSVASKLPRNCSFDAYLYSNDRQLNLGVTLFESSATRSGLEAPLPLPIDTTLGPADNSNIVDSVGLFDTETYISGMHGRHIGGKTSSFKRCLFFKETKLSNVTDFLTKAIERSPTPISYVHLLQGGGAVSDIAADATAFGCRDWDFACVITGVWSWGQDNTQVAQSVVRWVYNVAEDLLPFSSGAYGADLGPDPRDAVLVAKAFGPNQKRLACLKSKLDPHNILAYACPLPKAQSSQKVIILVTGESCAGKDFCAEVWASIFNTRATKRLRARVVSISDATKREYAAANGADLHRLLCDRDYKEHHRPALTAYFKKQLQQRPQLLKEHFLDVIRSTEGVDVLFITGMRDKSPLATYSHLVPHSRLLEVYIQASEQTQRTRRGIHGNNDGGAGDWHLDRSSLPILEHRPCLLFNNDTAGKEAAEQFGGNRLLPFIHEDLQALGNMVRPISDWPRPGIEFSHILDVAQQPGGLALCISLLQRHFIGDWNAIDAIVCCEAGGPVFASALALRVNVPLVLVRETGKLPPPVHAIEKSSSHISSFGASSVRQKMIEIEQHRIPKGASVVVIDDTLATGETLCAVLQLLEMADVSIEGMHVMVVAEFPFHNGRKLLQQRGFGKVGLQSLLVKDGA